ASAGLVASAAAAAAAGATAGTARPPSAHTVPLAAPCAPLSSHSSSASVSARGTMGTLRHVDLAADAVSGPLGAIALPRIAPDSHLPALPQSARSASSRAEAR